MATLLIDLDGTLIDSFPGIRDSFLKAVAAAGWPTPEEDFVAGIAGPPMEQTLTRLGMDKATVTRTLETYLRFYGDTGVHNATPFPGMRELLEKLKASGHTLCTATSKGEHFARLSLDRFDMFEFFDVFAAAEENGARRTKAQVIAYCIEQLGDRFDPADTLMIGDRSHDIDGANQFGIPTVAVGWGYGNEEEYAQARWVARTRQELEDIICDFS
ncbi:HAD-IA family hydrolase [Corynebacterium mendelii]|uniref:HAD-IA family hydrolase n=1 Tax=Corynebacterium mendelii TaxID=2765362 RepID=UPI003635857C